MKNVLQDKKSQRLCILLIALSLLLITLLSTATPTAHAYDWTGKNTPWETTWNQIKDDLSDKSSFLGVAWTVATTAAGSNPDFNLTKIAEPIFKLPSGSWISKGAGMASSGEYHNPFINAAAAMYNTMKVVGMALVILFFLIELLDEVQADNFNYEHLIKKLITLAVGLLVVANGADIFAAITNWGNSMLDVACEAVSAGNATLEDTKIIYETLNSAGGDGIFSGLLAVLEALAIICDNILPFLLFCVAFIIAYIVSFSRFIEILVRFAFAPIGLAPIVSGGAKSSGMRYAKKFAAVCLQGAVCIVAIGASQMVITMQSEVGSIFAKVLVPLTLIGFLLKTGRIADDICGV